MRSDQHIGLPPEAEAFLEEHRRPVKCCPTCGHEQAQSLEVIGHYSGMFGDQYPLCRHPLKEGWANAYLQASPWSSGPMFFIGLRIYKADGSLEGTIQWTNQQIEEMV